MWTKDFWKATVERMVRAGAAAVGSVWIVGDGVMNALNVNWEESLGIFLGGAAVSLVLALAGGAVGSGEGPSFSGTERVTPKP